MTATATIAELLAARTDDGNPGLLAGDRTWTWAEVVAESGARAAVLDELGLGLPGHHVGVLLDNVPEYVFLLGAAALSGSVVVGVNPTRRGEELARDVRHTDCAVVLTDAIRAVDVASGDGDAALQEMSRAGATLETSDGLNS